MVVVVVVMVTVLVMVMVPVKLLAFMPSQIRTSNISPGTEVFQNVKTEECMDWKRRR